MLRNYLIIALGVVSVSFAAIFIRLAEAPPLVIAAYRLIVASIILWPITIAYSHIELSKLTRKDVILSLISGIFLALHFGLWISSLNYTSVATSVILVTSSPVFVAIASFLLFKEKIFPKVIIGIIICFIGTAFIGFGNWNVNTTSFIGGILAFSGAIAVSVYVIIGRRLRRTMGILVYGSLTFSSAAILLLVACVIWNYQLWGYSGHTILMMVLLALVPQMLGHLSLNWSLRFVSATLITIAVLGEPIGANILAYFFLDETPKLFEIIGSILILTGIFVAFRKNSGVAFDRN